MSHLIRCKLNINACLPWYAAQHFLEQRVILLQFVLAHHADRPAKHGDNFSLFVHITAPDKTDIAFIPFKTVSDFQSFFPVHPMFFLPV